MRVRASAASILRRPLLHSEQEPCIIFVRIIANCAVDSFTLEYRAPGPLLRFCWLHVTRLQRAREKYLWKRGKWRWVRRISDSSEWMHYYLLLARNASSLFLSLSPFPISKIYCDVSRRFLTKFVAYSLRLLPKFTEAYKEKFLKAYLSAFSS